MENSNPINYPNYKLIFKNLSQSLSPKILPIQNAQIKIINTLKITELNSFLEKLDILRNE